jgi:hypothetical protein
MMVSQEQSCHVHDNREVHLVTQKNNARFIFALALAVILASCIFAAPAKADDGAPGGLGSGSQKYTPSAYVQWVYQQKHHLALEAQLVSQGKLAESVYLRDLAKLYQELHVTRSSSHNTSLSITPDTLSKVLNLTQIAQQKTYYCGPASAEMVLRYLGHDTSQSTLASSAYLNTDNNGGTNYGDNVMAPTINKLGYTGGFYIQTNATTTSTYSSDMTSDINQNWPVVIAAHEDANNELNSTENDWYHWYVVRGYSGSGGYSDYADPASGIWNVPAYGSVGSYIVNGMMLNGGFGYVW